MQLIYDKINHQQIMNIKERYPPFELSYVKTIHKKVSSANLYYLIPKGKKYFVWFRYFKNKEACLFLEINSKEKTIKEIIVKVPAEVANYILNQKRNHLNQ